VCSDGLSVYNLAIMLDCYSSATAQQLMYDGSLSRSVLFVSYAAGGLGLIPMCTH